jgi:predicted amidophosphoribosyltransferase
MFCKNCQYDLRQLQAHRCPECGQAFDPTEPSTYLESLPREAFFRRHRILAILAFIFVGLGVAFLIQFAAAASQSGR